MRKSLIVVALSFRIAGCSVYDEDTLSGSGSGGRAAHPNGGDGNTGLSGASGRRGSGGAAYGGGGGGDLLQSAAGGDAGEGSDSDAGAGGSADGGASANGGEPTGGRLTGGRTSASGGTRASGGAVSGGAKGDGGAISGGARTSGGDSSGGASDGGTLGRGGAIGNGGSSFGGSSEGGTDTSSGGSGNVRELVGIASADSEQSITGNVHPASHGNDGDATTRWAAADGKAGHYWTLDLGAAHALSRVEIMWEYPIQAVGKPYRYTLNVSDDGVAYDLVVDRSATTDSTQTQTADVPAGTSGRYVRVVVTALPGPDSLGRTTFASFFETRVFGQ